MAGGVGQPSNQWERAPSAPQLLAAEGGARLAGRVGELTGALDQIAQNSRTEVAMSTREGIDVLAGGVRDLSPAQRALAAGDDILGRLPGALPR